MKSEEEGGDDVRRRVRRSIVNPCESSNETRNTKEFKRLFMVGLSTRIYCLLFARIGFSFEDVEIVWFSCQ